MKRKILGNCFAVGLLLVVQSVQASSSSQEEPSLEEKTRQEYHKAVALVNEGEDDGREECWNKLIGYFADAKESGGGYFNQFVKIAGDYIEAGELQYLVYEGIAERKRRLQKLYAKKAQIDALQKQLEANDTKVNTQLLKTDKKLDETHSKLDQLQTSVLNMAEIDPAEMARIKEVKTINKAIQEGKFLPALSESLRRLQNLSGQELAGVEWNSELGDVKGRDARTLCIDLGHKLIEEATRTLANHNPELKAAVKKIYPESNNAYDDFASAVVSASDNEVTDETLVGRLETLSGDEAYQAPNTQDEVNAIEETAQGGNYGPLMREIARGVRGIGVGMDPQAPVYTAYFCNVFIRTALSKTVNINPDELKSEYNTAETLSSRSCTSSVTSHSTHPFPNKPLDTNDSYVSGGYPASRASAYYEEEEEIISEGE